MTTVERQELDRLRRNLEQERDSLSKAAAPFPGSARSEFELIEAGKAQFPRTRMCRHLGARSGKGRSPSGGSGLMRELGLQARVPRGFVRSTDRNRSLR